MRYNVRISFSLPAMTKRPGQTKVKLRLADETIAFLDQHQNDHGYNGSTTAQVIALWNFAVGNERRKSKIVVSASQGGLGPVVKNLWLPYSVAQQMGQYRSFLLNPSKILDAAVTYWAMESGDKPTTRSRRPNRTNQGKSTRDGSIAFYTRQRTPEAIQRWEERTGDRRIRKMIHRIDRILAHGPEVTKKFASVDGKIHHRRFLQEFPKGDFTETMVWEYFGRLMHENKENALSRMFGSAYAAHIITNKLPHTEDIYERWLIGEMETYLGEVPRNDRHSYSLYLDGEGMNLDQHTTDIYQQWKQQNSGW